MFDIVATVEIVAVVAEAVAAGPAAPWLSDICHGWRSQ